MYNFVPKTQCMVHFTYIWLYNLYGNFMLGKYTSPIENLGVDDP